MVQVRENLVGKEFGRLKVIERAEDYVDINGKHKVRWICECNCENHNIVTVLQSSLKNGSTKSCGCLRRESVKNLNKSKKKTNHYDDSVNGIITGYTMNTNEPFYFNEEFFDVVKKVCWNAYIHNGIKELIGHDPNTYKIVKFHKYIGYSNYDHEDRNELNNIIDNLRPATNAENARNRSVQCNNSSGVTGVTFHKNKNKWCANIQYNYKRICLGYFDEFNDAVRARLEAEAKYYKEFAPQKYLYEKYNIKEVIYNENCN